MPVERRQSQEEDQHVVDVHWNSMNDSHQFQEGFSIEDISTIERRKSRLKVGRITYEKI